MVSLGCDFAYARPGGAALKAAGVVAVGRYLADDSRGITNAEYLDLVAHGVGLWLVREGVATGMLNGWAQGVSDAQLALSQIASQGLPAGSPVYWAADFDIAPGTAAVAAAEAYVDGWNTVIPAGRRGGYGGLWFLDYIHGKGKVDFLWECASTSFRHGVDPASVPLHLQQTTDTPPLPGTDYNNIFDTASFAGLNSTPLAPKLEDDEMIKIYSPNRQSALIGPGYAYPLDTDEKAAQAESIATKVIQGNDRQYDLWMAMATQGRETPAPAAPVDYTKLATAVVALLPSQAAVTQEQVSAAVAKALQGLTLKAQ